MQCIHALTYLRACVFVRVCVVCLCVCVRACVCMHACVNAFVDLCTMTSLLSDKPSLARV